MRYARIREDFVRTDGSSYFEFYVEKVGRLYYANERGNLHKSNSYTLEELLKHYSSQYREASEEEYLVYLAMGELVS